MVIDSDGKLSEFLPKLRAAPRVALDTEADSLHAYPEKLCLLQISAAEADVLIDPLARIDLRPLWPVLQQQQLILHGADYDLRLLRRKHDFVPRHIFDTMLASRLLGEREFGLFHLVRKHLGVTLEKGSQKADWAVRPLTPRMAAYARNDTHYLKPLSDILREQLRQKQRLAWLEQSCDRLIADCSRPTRPDPDVVWRLKGCHVLSRRALAVLREMWRWREQEALAGNRPPYFVLNHVPWSTSPRPPRGRPRSTTCCRAAFRPGARTGCWRRCKRDWLWNRKSNRSRCARFHTGRRRPSAAVAWTWNKSATTGRPSWIWTRRSSPAAPPWPPWRAIGRRTRTN